jgi:hypothetical protein
MKISNLYRGEAQQILLFKECWASEKVHGTSAHIGFGPDGVKLFSGGASHDEFAKLFNLQELMDKVYALFTEFVVGQPLPTTITVYGEAYGGKMQAMSGTYGKQLMFIAFEVKIGDKWLSPAKAKDVATQLGFEFVPCELIPADMEHIDFQRNRPSEVAFLRGCADRNDPATWKKREGVVVRPVEEMTLNNGGRIIAKHKNEEFQERKTQPKVGDKAEMLAEAEKISDEWVTMQRLQHILTPDIEKIEFTKNVIDLMITDIETEAAGEIVPSPQARKAIGCRTARLFKQHLSGNYVVQA